MPDDIGRGRGSVVLIRRSGPSPAESHPDEIDTSDHAQGADHRPYGLAGHERTADETDALTEPDDTHGEEDPAQGEEGTHAHTVWPVGKEDRASLTPGHCRL